jgi:hypothetical protein
MLLCQPEFDLRSCSRTKLTKGTGLVEVDKEGNKRYIREICDGFLCSFQDRHGFYFFLLGASSFPVFA